jgi:hypothetical protein
MSRHRLLLSLLFLVPLLFSSCQDSGTSGYPGIQANKSSAAAAIKAEEPGDYFIGRRFYKVDYKFWGYIRKPGEPWSTAKLVMLNEQHTLAPDRAAGHIGSDNGYEYKLLGNFSGETVYEPASNGKYPEFVLKSAELRSVSPPNIFRESGATDPERRIIAKPY